MPYTDRFIKVLKSQYALWQEQDKVRATLSKSMEEYKTGKLNSLVDIIVQKPKNEITGQDLDYTPSHLICEKVSSLLICEKPDVLLDARKMFLSLSEAYPHKMMEEMDRIELFMGGLRVATDYPILHSGYHFFKKDFEDVGAVKKILIEKLGERAEKQDKRGKSPSRRKLRAPPPSAEVESFLMAAFAELKDWNEKNPAHLLKFNEAFLISVDIKDAPTAQIRRELGTGKYCQQYRLYRKLLQAQHANNAADLSFFKYLLHNFVTDKNLLKEMQASFDFDTTACFERICHEFLDNRGKNGAKKNFCAFAFNHDKIARMGQNGEKEQNYFGTLQKIKNEFKLLGKAKQREYGFVWLSYAISKYIKDPELKSKMEFELGGLGTCASSDRKTTEQKTDCAPRVKSGKSWRHAFSKNRAIINEGLARNQAKKNLAEKNLLPAT